MRAPTVTSTSHAAFAALALLALLALPARAAPPIIIETPSILEGDFVTPEFYFGRISIGAQTDDPAFGSGKLAEYSLDGGATFHPAAVETGAGVQRVNTTTLREQSGASVATLGGGGYVVAWSSRGNAADGFSVFAQRYDAQGQPAGGEFQVNTHTALEQSQPAVAALADGGFVISWTSESEDGSLFGVYAQRFSADGARRGGAFRVNDHVTNSQLRPAVAGLASGGFVITWQSLGQVGSGSGYDLFAKLYDAQGAVVPPPPPLGCVAGKCELPVNFLTAGQQTDPSIAALSTGGFVVTWTSEATGADGDDEVYFRKFDTAGTPATSAELLLRGVEPTPARSQRTTSVTAWGEGGFAATWVTETPSPSTAGSDVFLQAFDAGGLPIFSAGDVPVNLAADGNQSAPAIAPLSDGGVLVTWFDALTTPRVIKARRYDAGLLPITGELAIAPPDAGNTANPVVAALPQGAFAIAWEASGNPADPSITGIFARRFTKALLVARDLRPTGDLDLRFRLGDQSTPPERWLSPVRRYRHGDPDAGSDGAVVYPDGFTRGATATVGLVLPGAPISLDHLQLHQRIAPLASGQCGAYEPWLPVGTQSTLIRSVEVALADATCNQFKWEVVNALGVHFEHESPNVLGVDRAPPLVVASHQQVGSLLRVTVGVIEPGAGVAAQAYVANRGQPVAFSSSEVYVPLRDGANSVRIDVTDRAGNVGTAGFFTTVDLTPPSIQIHTLEEGQTYGGELVLFFTTSQPLTQLAIEVDGIPTDSTDLSSLPDGAHHVRISGRDAQGQLIEAAVSFTIARELFTLSLLSPQARTYPEDEVVVAFRASRPLTGHAVILDGVPQASLALRGLSNGEHTITLQATADGGSTRTITRTFTVALETPSLAVTHPSDGQLLQSRALSLDFEANSAVEVRIGETRSAVVSGSILTLPGEGAQQLTLTATHPNGTSISRTINVTVDSLAPSLTLASPAPKLYAAGAIPIEFRANKAVRDVVFHLDGAEVTALDAVPDGAHVFEVTAIDSAGRVARATVPFQVAHLEIVAPREGEKLIDNNLPPVVTLEWSAGGNFSALTAAVDGGEEQLLPAQATTAPLQLAGGHHEIILRGKLNELVLARSVRFKAGARNVRVNQNGIKYAFANCDDELYCDVDVTLQLENVGDYDLTGAIPVVFEVIAGGDGDGEVSVFEWTVDGIAVGEKRSVTLSSFRARLEDRFRLSIDPERTLPAEDTRDNVYEVAFQPGKILEVQRALSASNFYISGARTDNLFAVATAGPVAFVEFQAGNVFFRDSSGEQGFASPVDMGLLTPEANYVIIKAYGAGNRLLDSRIEYFEVRGLHAAYPVTDRASPWRFFLGAGNRILVDQIDQRALARAELRALREALGEDAITIYRTEVGVDAEGKQKVDYGLTLSDAPSLERSGTGTSMGAGGLTTAAALGQGSKAVGSFTRLALGDGACLVSGFSAITGSQQHKRAITDGLDALADLANVLIDTELEPMLEAQINDAFNKLQGTLAPFTDGFGLGVVLPGFFAFAVGDLDIVPPNVSDIRFQFAGDIEDFVLDTSMADCAVRLVGTQIFVDSTITFDMSFRRRFTLAADVSGGASGFVFGGLGFGLPIPAIAVFGFAYANIELIGPTFTGAMTVDMHYSGGLRGALPTPSLTIDAADVFIGFRIPLQTQKVAEGDVYAFVWVPFISVFFIVGTHVEIDAFAEVQVETVLDNHLHSPIVLANPAYGFGLRPDTDSFTAPTGHVFNKLRSIVFAEISACFLFICVPITTHVEQTDIDNRCLKVENLALVPGTPGVDCPRSVPDFPFPR